MGPSYIAGVMLQILLPFSELCVSFLYPSSLLLEVYPKEMKACSPTV